MKNRILIIDDDEDYLSELSNALVGAGYDVMASSRPYTALEQTMMYRPDIILLDLNMRDISGFEIATLLKREARTAQIPIMAMSGFYILKEYEFLANICKIEKFFRKPLMLKDLIKEIEEMFRNESISNNAGYQRQNGSKKNIIDR